MVLQARENVGVEKVGGPEGVGVEGSEGAGMYIRGCRDVYFRAREGAVVCIASQRNCRDEKARGPEGVGVEDAGFCIAEGPWSLGDPATLLLLFLDALIANALVDHQKNGTEFNFALTFQTANTTATKKLI